VAGSVGIEALAIAEKFENIQIIVQDLPDVVARGPASLPAVPCKDRISFQAHDFFTEQTTIADAYLLRHNISNWSDADCERIIRNMTPAMRPKSRLLVMDALLPEPGTIPPFLEKLQRANDISLFSMFSCQERSLEEMRKLVELCDSRLKFELVYQPPASASSLISWVYMTE
jgi:6-hydroxytryprostatin B O-methyltransferase